jgi:ATP:ADP antiporter, AAA family
MLITAVDQQAKYKAKNVIDTVVYRFGDLTSSWLSAAVLPFGVTGLAIFGIVISAVWFPIAYLLGRSYERALASTTVTTQATAAREGSGQG